MWSSMYILRRSVGKTAGQSLKLHTPDSLAELRNDLQKSRHLRKLFVKWRKKPTNSEERNILHLTSARKPDNVFREEVAEFEGRFRELAW
jgi:hypothetical protein